MSEKVWIGKDDAEFWDDLNKLPGDLLASFKTKVGSIETDSGRRKPGLLFTLATDTCIKKGDPVTVLILACSDEGTGVK